MGNRIVQILVLCLLLISSSVIQIQSFETGELSSEHDEININIPIEIKFWNFPAQYQADLINQIPEKISQETRIPGENRTGKFQRMIVNKPFEITNNLDIKSTSIDNNNFSSLKQYFQDISTTISAPDPRNSSNSIFGRYTTIDQLSPFFENFTSQGEYTLHLVNLTQSTHWYQVGQTKSISSILADMRNIGIVGKRSLLFDPSAIAPYFDWTKNDTILNQSSTTQVSLVIRQLVENFIVGSPMSDNYQELKQYVHFSSIVLRDSITDITSAAASTIFHSRFEQQIIDLFPAYNIKHNKKIIDLQNQPKIQGALDDATKIIDGVPTIVVDSEFAENMKNLVRNTFRSVYKSSAYEFYFYGYFFFADNVEKRFIYKSNSVEEYNVGELGFALDTYYDLMNQKFPFIPSNTYAAKMIRLLGIDFGLPLLNSGMVRQLDTPMSSYGISTHWSNSLTQFEIDNIQRHLDILYRTYSQVQISTLSNQLDNSLFYWWYEPTRFTNASTLISSADNLMEQMKFGEAMKKLVTAYNEVNKEIEDIGYLYTGGANTPYFIIFMSIFALYVKYMREASIDKQKLKERINRIKQHNIETNEN